MARKFKIKFKKGDEYLLRLERLESGTDEIVRNALYDGAKIVADEVKSNIKGLNLIYDELYFKKDLERSFGITPMRSEGGGWNVKLGFDGYGTHPTVRYPEGLPNQMIARAIESGTSFRPAKPFVRPAVNATRKQAIAAMHETIDKEIEKTMK